MIFKIYIIIILAFFLIVSKEKDDYYLWALRNGVYLDRLKYNESGIYTFANKTPGNLMISNPKKFCFVSTENYPFKEKFSISTICSLVGRIIVELFKAEKKKEFTWLNELPQFNDLNDFYHFPKHLISELNKRLLIIISKNKISCFKEIWKLLISIIEQDLMNIIKFVKVSALIVLPMRNFNFKLFNWAYSLIESSTYFYDDTTAIDVTVYSKIDNHPNINFMIFAPIFNYFDKKSKIFWKF